MHGAVREIFRPHSHDAGDSIDDALESDRRGIRTVKISFAVLFVTAVVQLVIVVVTGSVALFADTIHNFSDSLTAIPLFIAFRLGRRPANARYTYGYRRAEDLAGLFVLAMIAISAVVAAWQAVDRLVNPRPLDHLGVLFARRSGRVRRATSSSPSTASATADAIGSAALVADGYHARTDGFTSLAVVVGAVGVWAGFERADPIVGLVISIAIFAVLRGAARQIYHRLMDAVDPDIVDDITHQALHTPGVRAVTATQVRWLGHRLVADLTIDVEPAASVHDGHQIASATRARLIDHVAHIDDVHIHVHPYQPGDESHPLGQAHSTAEASRAVAAAVSVSSRGRS